MSLSFVIVILVSLAFAPVLSLRLFGEAAHWQENQVALDNAAIRLGRSDRDLFQYVASANRLLIALEKWHHPVHLCARVPKTAAACRPKDLLLETKISALRNQIHALAAQMWTRNGTQALAEVSRLGPVRWKREASIPLQSVRCRLCHLPVLWERDELGSTRSTYVTLSPRRLEISVRLDGGSLTRPGRWRYRLDPLGEDLK